MPAMMVGWGDHVVYHNCKGVKRVLRCYYGRKVRKVRLATNDNSDTYAVLTRMHRFTSSFITFSRLIAVQSCRIDVSLLVASLREPLPDIERNVISLMGAMEHWAHIVVFLWLKDRVGNPVLLIWSSPYGIASGRTPLHVARLLLFLQ